MSRTDLAAALVAGPVLLDGGLATELEAAGHDLSGTLWSGRLLLESPEAVTAAHARFFAAGARVATTASYQLSYDGLAAVGVERDAADGLLRRSVEVAASARASAADPEGCWVAASVGPYGAALADGSEYRGDYGLTVDQLRAWHRPRLAVLATAGADVLAMETIPCLAEVEALLAEVAGDAQVSDSQHGTPVPATSASSASTSARQGIVSIASTSAPALASTASRGRCQARS